MAAASYFTVKDTRYELVPVDDWTFEEAAEFQRVAGMPVGRAALAIAEMDVNAYRGWFTVCMQRVDPHATEQALTGLNFMDAVGSSERVEEDPDPPPDPQTAAPSENGGSGDEPSASQPTPAPSGTQHGSPSSG